MSNVLFITWDGGGNVPPALGIAAELQQRGHRVRVMGHPVQQRAGRGRGARLHGVPHRPALHGDRRQHARSTTSACSVTVRWVATSSRSCGASPPTSWSSTASCSGRWRRSRPRGVPYVVLEHMYDAYLSASGCAAPWASGWRSSGSRRDELLDAAAARLVACSRGARSRRQRPATGQPPLHGTRGDRVSRPRPPSRRCSSVSARSTSRARPERCRTSSTRSARSTCGASPRSGLRSASGTWPLRRTSSSAGSSRTPSCCPTVSMVIGHGGHATTMAALAHDLPVLVMPMHPMLDQKMVGQSLVDAGRRPARCQEGEARRDRRRRG